MELEERVTRGQRHLVQFGDIPRGNDDAAGIRIGAQGVQDLRDLVDVVSVGGRPAAPLHPIDRSQLAVAIGPFVPDGDAVLVQPLDIGIAAQEPEQFVDDRLQMNPLGGDQRESGRQVVAELMPENGPGPGTGAVGFGGAALEDQPEQILVLRVDCPGSSAAGGVRTGSGGVDGCAVHTRKLSPALMTASRLLDDRPGRRLAGAVSVGVGLERLWSLREAGPTAVSRCAAR